MSAPENLSAAEATPEQTFAAPTGDVPMSDGTPAPVSSRPPPSIPPTNLSQAAELPTISEPAPQPTQPQSQAQPSADPTPTHSPAPTPSKTAGTPLRNELQDGQGRGGAGSRAQSAHPDPSSAFPDKAAAHGAPVRQYLNTHVTGVLLEGMKKLGKEQ